MRWVLAAVAMTAASVAGAQPSDNVVTIAADYVVKPNITYRIVGGWDGKLDIIAPRGNKQPAPTVIYFHGGGMTNGDKDDVSYQVLPWIEMGWTVVTVDYRINTIAPAPASVEDARCALRWVYRNAKQYAFDTSRLVVSGFSAGSYLALMAGVLPTGTILDASCPGTRPGGTAGSGPVNTEELKVAAIVDWSGAKDVMELMPGGHHFLPSFTSWMGAQLDRAEIAKLVSPINYVRKGLPPIMTVTGDQDPIFPYEQSTRFHAALGKAGVPHTLYTIPGGGHGEYAAPVMIKAWGAVRAFLAEHKLPTAPPAAP